MDLNKQEQEIANIYMKDLTDLHESLTNLTLDKLSEETAITESMIEIASAVHENNIDTIIAEDLDIGLQEVDTLQESIVTVSDKVYIINESTQNLEFVAELVKPEVPITESELPEDNGENTPISENFNDNEKTEDIVQNIIDSLKI